MTECLDLVDVAIDIFYIDYFSWGEVRGGGSGDCGKEERVVEVV